MVHFSCILLLLDYVLLAVEVDCVLDHLFIEQLTGNDELTADAGDVTTSSQAREKRSTFWAEVDLW